MSSAAGDRAQTTSRKQRPALQRIDVLVAAAVIVAGGLVLVLATGAAAATVPAVPHAGPTGCGRHASHFGGGPYAEVRFSTLPDIGGTKTARVGGVTVTLRRLSRSTMAWQSTAGVDLVFVNAGSAPHASSAVYRYEPEATADSGLGGRSPSDVLDHVVVCIDETPTTPTTPPATSPPPQVTTTTLMTPIVSCAYPPTCHIANTTTTAPAATTTAPQQQVVTTLPGSTPAATTTVAFQLPDTGGDHDRLTQLGILMVGVGLLALVLAGQRRRPGTAEMPGRHASGPKPA